MGQRASLLPKSQSRSISPQWRIAEHDVKSRNFMSGKEGLSSEVCIGNDLRRKTDCRERPSAGQISGSSVITSTTTTIIIIYNSIIRSLILFT
jgi:hypothetical protein